METETISESIKALARELGAEASGIAPAARFRDAPEGFRPTDIWQDCRSVVVFLKRMPGEIILAQSPVPYTHAAYLIYAELDRLGLALCRALEERGLRAVPVPCDTPYLHWEPERSHGRGILSMRHAAWLAGLGILGRSRLFAFTKPVGLLDPHGNVDRPHAALTGQRQTGIERQMQPDLFRA